MTDLVGGKQHKELQMAGQQPLLSIVISCYNYEAYISDTIESVLSQDLSGVEVFVVDDGSTDQSWARIEPYKDRLTAIRTENRGPVAACMTGLESSRGKFIYFLDADDMLCPDALAGIRPHLRDNVSKIQFQLQPIDSVGTPIRSPYPILDPSQSSQALIDMIALRGSYPTPPTSGNVCRRDLYDGLGDVSYEAGAIDGVPHLLAPFVGDVVSIDRVLGLYRIHTANRTSFNTMSPERLDRHVNRFKARLHELRQLLASRGLAGNIQFRDDYAYTGELELMRSIVVGERPSYSQLKSYLGALRQEYTGASRVVRSTLAMLMFGLPLALSTKLVAIRLNPLSFKKLQTMVKMLAIRSGRQT